MALNPKAQQQGKPSSNGAGLVNSLGTPATHSSMLVHYPSLPVEDVQFQLRNGVELRDIIKTCANNGIEFKLLYDHGGKFRYLSDPCRASR